MSIFVDVKSFDLEVNGAWGDWSTWACDITCGSGGLSSRSRLCNNPPPQHGGLECSSEMEEEIIDTCDSIPSSCPVGPVDGEWGDWSAWTCDITCGSGGSSSRSRECNNPPPHNGGSECDSNAGEEILNTCTPQPSVCPGKA